jgi:hypothetical protein
MNSIFGCWHAAGMQRKTGKTSENKGIEQLFLKKSLLAITTLVLGY